MTTATKSQSPATIVIPPLSKRRLEVTLIGDSPLIVHSWSWKAIKEMLDKQGGKPRGKKEAKDPEKDFWCSLYFLSEDGTSALDLATVHEKYPGPGRAHDELQGKRFGFPAIGVKAAAVSACRLVDGISMTFARQAFHVWGTGCKEFVEIQGSPSMREDMVRIGQGTADIRYRAQFERWRMNVLVEFTQNAISEEQILNLLNIAGFNVGLAEWRPERNGMYGLFHVATQEEVVS